MSVSTNRAYSCHCCTQLLCVTLPASLQAHWKYITCNWNTTGQSHSNSSNKFHSTRMIDALVSGCLWALGVSRSERVPAGSRCKRTQPPSHSEALPRNHQAPSVGLRLLLQTTQPQSQSEVQPARSSAARPAAKSPARSPAMSPAKSAARPLAKSPAKSSAQSAEQFVIRLLFHPRKQTAERKCRRQRERGKHIFHLGADLFNGRWKIKSKCEPSSAP